MHSWSSEWGFSIMRLPVNSLWTVCIHPYVIASQIWSCTRTAWTILTDTCLIPAAFDYRYLSFDFACSAIYVLQSIVIVQGTDIWEQTEKGSTSVPSGVCWWLKKGWVPVDVFSTGWWHPVSAQIIPPGIYFPSFIFLTLNGGMVLRGRVKGELANPDSVQDGR